MTASLPHGLTDCLLWSDELGMGFHPRPPMDYSGPYFEKYQALDATPMGAALTAARVDMVQRHFDGEVLDVGIGGGRFVIESGGKGFDVNEEAVQWLKSRNAYADPYKGVAAITCWDSLEHVPDPDALVRSVGEWVFVSMPVYKDQADCLKSKHFKPGEHLHYWSVRGLIGWFAKMNFGCVEINGRESDLGREGITSFAFRRFHG
ncbi:TPA: methyltransferase domain-containing protein [Pseudomonas aeruginosa]|nr:methyltransferase domain-containing protein [Pseudomonas aeruginosa]